MSRPKLRDIQPAGPLAERQLPDGRRRINLRRDEREALVRRERAEAAAALFLDLEQGRTWAQIAQELALSTSQLKDLTKTKEFDEAYGQLFAELGHDPRFRAAQAAVSDLLPLAVTQLKAMLVSPSTPAGVRLKAIQQIFSLNGLAEPQRQVSDRQELATFLVQHNLNIGQMGIALPPEYLQALEQATVVDGAFVDPEGEPSTNSPSGQGEISPEAG